MRVAVVHSHFLLYWPARLRVLADRLRRRGDELVVVEAAGRDATYPFAPATTGELDGVQWIRLFAGSSPTRLRASMVSQALWRALDGVAPQVILASAIAFPTGATATRWARYRGRGVIIMDNARRQDVPRARVVDAVKRRVYRNVDAVLIPAPSHTPSYLWWGLPVDRIFHGLNVVDNAWLARTAAAWRRDGRADGATPRLPRRFFLGVGRQVPKKNWATLLAAYAVYRRRAGATAWALVLVGDGPERGKLECLVAARGAGDVHFHPFCPRADLCRYYAAAGALLLPSFHGETWGAVVNEAMACGLPVLVSDECGCAAALVRAGENGWTFSPHRVEQLAGALCRMASLAERQRSAMGARSQALIAEWPLERFAEGAVAAIDACKTVRRGFTSLADRLLLAAWKGRYRPT